MEGVHGTWHLKAGISNFQDFALNFEKIIRILEFVRNNISIDAILFKTV